MTLRQDGASFAIGVLAAALYGLFSALYALDGLHRGATLLAVLMVVCLGWAYSVQPRRF